MRDRAFRDNLASHRIWMSAISEDSEKYGKIGFECGVDCVCDACGYEYFARHDVHMLRLTELADVTLQISRD